MDGETTEQGDRHGGGPVLGRPKRMILGVLFLGGVLAFVYFRLDWQDVLAVLGRADPSLVVAGALAALVGVAAWGEGLRGLLPAEATPVSRRRGFLIFSTGMLVRNVVPVGYASSVAVLGYVYRREADLSMDRSLAAVSVAEVANMVASTSVAVSGVVLLVLVGPRSPLLPWLVAGAGLVVLGGTAIGLVLWYRLEAVQRLAHAGASLLARVADRLADRDAGPLAPESVEAAIGSYYGSLSTVSARRRAVGRALCFAVLAWLGFATSLYACGLAVGLEIPFAVAMIVVTIGGYATILPVPGGLGGYELGVAGGIALLSAIAVAPALAATLLFRVASYWFVVGVGLVAAVLLSVDVRRLVATAIGPDRSESGPTDR